MTLRATPPTHFDYSPELQQLTIYLDRNSAGQMMYRISDFLHQNRDIRGVALVFDNTTPLPSSPIGDIANEPA